MPTSFDNTFRLLNDYFMFEFSFEYISLYVSNILLSTTSSSMFHFTCWGDFLCLYPFFYPISFSSVSWHTSATVCFLKSILCNIFSERMVCLFNFAFFVVSVEVERYYYQPLNFSIFCLIYFLSLYVFPIKEFSSLSFLF